MALFDRSSMKEGVSRREGWSWALFDAANSGYTTVVLTAVFNAYFVSVVCSNAEWATLAWTLAVAASNLVCLLVMPGLSRSADLNASKKKWLAGATWLCIAATFGLAFAGPGSIALALVMVVLSNVGYSVGESLSSAFLPELARPEAMGRVSGWGWATGYIGGLVTLALCLAAVVAGEMNGVSASGTTAAACVITAVMFLLGSAPMLAFVKERAVPQKGRGRQASGILAGAGQIARSAAILLEFRDFRTLVCCGFLYLSGVSTVISLAAIYASAVMGFSTVETLVLVIIVNVTAAAGAFGFGYIQDRLGHRKALGTTLALWVVMAALTYMAESVPVFWVAANLAGFAMGSCQSAGRAMVGVLAPKKRLAEFYALWNMAQWTSAIVGPVIYGIVTWVTGNNHRLAIMATGSFFVLALAVLQFIDMERGEAAAAACDSAEG